MDIQQFLMYVFVVFVLLFIFELYKINSRIKCRFTGRDKRIQTKWVKPINNERINFGVGWYYVLTNRIRFDRAFFGLLPVSLLEFSYKSIWPVDPETGEADAETPESRKNLNKREDIEALNLGSQRALGKQKLGMVGGWMPIAMLIGIVASLYFNYQAAGKIDMLGAAINVLQEMAMK